MRFPWIAALPVLLSVPAHAQLQVVHIADPWIRFVTRSTPAGGYFTITNVGSKPVVITGASSPECGSIMLHQSMTQGGMESMQMVSRVVVPGHGEVKFQPGGYHLMCMQPGPGMKPGAKVPVTIMFADKRLITRPFTVRGAMGQ